MLRKLLFLLKDEVGFLQALIPTAISAGLSFLGKDKAGDMPGVSSWPGTRSLQNKLSENVLGKIGSPTQFSTNEDFRLPKPEVESEVENTILGRLKNPIKPSAYSSDITQKHYQSRKDRLEESFEDERKKSMDRYNRLGLSSSTPGLQAQQDIDKDQRLAEDEISSGLMYEDIERDLDATKMAEEILSNYVGKGTVLGGQQREYEKFPMQMTQEDLKRMMSEEQLYGNQALSYLGKGAVTPGQQYQSNMNQWGQPNIWDMISQGGIGNVLGDQLGQIFSK